MNMNVLDCCCCMPPPPPRKVFFSKFWKEDLVYNGKTVSSCSSISCKIFDLSTMCHDIWRHYKRILPKKRHFKHFFIYLFQFFETELYDLFIFTSTSILVWFCIKFCDFLWKCWIQDGGSMIRALITSQPTRISHLVEKGYTSHPPCTMVEVWIFMNVRGLIFELSFYSLVKIEVKR